LMERYKCAGCGAPAPKTGSSFSLISPEHGWRLSRRQNPDGSVALDWFCKPCWRVRKERVPKAPAEPETAAGKSFKSAIASLKRRPSSKPPR
jgi:hypothetical protein